MHLRGSSALVTGASRGIGRAIALALAEEGSAVALVARDAHALARLEADIRGRGGRALAVAGDLRDRAFCREAVDSAVRAHGRLQILVNNAGVGAWAALGETSDETWETVLETNLSSVFRLTRAALPQLTDGGGHVVMISSLAGSNPIVGMSAYCASKAALDHLSRCLMLEVRDHGVRVSVVAPGSVATSFGGSTARDESWMLRAEDVAAAVMDILRLRDAGHLSRIEMRPSRPQKRS
jgi:NAD(P)-dependent dehydrogenase (short-subunit alcohol dehydrogenase family)